MSKSLIKILVGALLLGAGAGLMFSARRELEVPCEDCDEEKTSEETSNDSPGE